MNILFATSNEHKFSEASVILQKYGIGIDQFKFQHREIRSDDVEEVAKEAAEGAYAECGVPVFVEDTGLFIKSLKGFPGTYSGWVLKKIGGHGILKLMESEQNRKAYFETCIAYHNKEEIITFKERCKGSIATEIRGSSGFGYDPIFIPDGYKRTFSESITLKNKLSHRYKTLLRFSTFLNSYGGRS